MSISNEKQADGVAIWWLFGAIFLLLIGLMAFQPEARVWMEAAVTADLSIASGRVLPIGPGQEQRRRPIEPAAWGEVVIQKNEFRRDNRATN